MKPMKCLLVVGTRPEAIKMAPVIKAMKKDSRFEVVVVATGQHREMLYPLLHWFGIKEDYHLDVMSPGQPLSHLAGKLMHHLYDIIEKELPDAVVVQGDTTTVFAGALAAHYAYDYYLRNDINDRKPIRVAHVEAGLRTYDNYAPFPEEVNRRLVGHIAHWNFAPTSTAAEALYDENITANVFITGNTVIDALMETVELIKQNPRNPLPDSIKADDKVILVTGHRRENYGGGFEHICAAIKEIALKYPKAHVVYPVHLNQHVKGPVTEMLGNIDNVHLLEPMHYPDFVATMMRAHIILTDSGGVQEEAPSLGKPVLVMREVTERPEAVVAGTVKIVGADTAKIVAETSALMDSDEAYNAMASAVNPYGDGKATQRILNLMCDGSAEDNSFIYNQ